MVFTTYYTCRSSLNYLVDGAGLVRDVVLVHELVDHVGVSAVAAVAGLGRARDDHLIIDNVLCMTPCVNSICMNVSPAWRCVCPATGPSWQSWSWKSWSGVMTWSRPRLSPTSSTCPTWTKLRRRHSTSHNKRGGVDYEAEEESVWSLIILRNKVLENTVRYCHLSSWKALEAILKNFEKSQSVLAHYFCATI